jgi:tetratricopeptide (TPR) repeat protein
MPTSLLNVDRRSCPFAVSEVDPSVVGSGVAVAVRSLQFRFDHADELSKMRAAAEKAIEVDPLLAEAHSVQKHTLSRGWPSLATLGKRCAVAAVAKSFGRAIELAPSSSESFDRFAMFLLSPLGRMEEALQKLRMAQKADPLSPHILDNLASVLIAVSRYDEASSYRERLPADYSGWAELVAAIRLQRGRIGEAIHNLETAFNHGVSAGSPVRGTLGVAYVRDRPSRAGGENSGC